MSLTIPRQTTIIDLLSDWLSRQVSKEGLNWLEKQQQKIVSSNFSPRVFFTAFSAVPRYTSKQQLQLNEADLHTAQLNCPGWSPQFWRIDQAARTLLVMSLAQKDRTYYLKTLERVFTAADVGELVALYQMLAILPYPEQYRLRAAEGIRSNITVVFNAVALRNPYPAKYFDELAWNQMVLKALFVGSPLYLIQGLERRANPTLSQMLIDYARERWAAKRSVSPELWRAMGRFADKSILADWEQILAKSESCERLAVALACYECSLPQAQSLLEKYPNLQKSIDSGKLSWSNITDDLAVAESNSNRF